MSATTESKKPVRKRGKNGNIYIGIIVFVVVTIYLSGYLVTYLSKTRVPTETVEMGTLETPRQIEGIIIRSEALVLSTTEGEPYFSYGENQRVRKGGLVCSVKDADNTTAIEEQISSYDENLYALQKVRQESELAENSAEVKELAAQLGDIINLNIPKYVKSEPYDILNLKAAIEENIDMRNQLLLSERGSSLQKYTDGLENYMGQLDEYIAQYTAEESGIVSYRLDGYETVLTPSVLDDISLDTIQTPIQPGREILSRVKPGEPIFKIITSNTWYIAAYIPQETAQKLTEGVTIKLFIVTDNEETPISMKIMRLKSMESQAYLVLQSDKQMIDFLDRRNITFELRENKVTGIKVPNRAIVEKTLIKIPREFVKEEDGVFVVSRVVGEATETVGIRRTAIDDEFVYINQDFGQLRIGDYIFADEEQYKLGDVKLVQGVYVANSGTANFRPVTILDQNANYAIVESQSSGSVKPYDRIISDARNIVEDQMVY